jgi:glycerol-3-phosphate dehydrogenase
VTGFRIHDLETSNGHSHFEIRAHKTIVCAGPWTDEMGERLSPDWNRWLNPSKGVHLIFDLKRIPIPGAMVMNHPEDGRIAFVIPRPDFGPGVVIVGTTDGPTPDDPSKATVSAEDVDYLMDLLNRYFPELQLSHSDILSAYVGVRPLMGDSFGQEKGEQSGALQKVSREHHIGFGPGGTVVVAGGKYTTHRKMAEEIVDFTLKSWREESRKHHGPEYPKEVKPSSTRAPINPLATAEAIQELKEELIRDQVQIPEALLSRYGGEAKRVLHYQAHQSRQSQDRPDPEGFPLLEAQFRHSMRSEMVMHLEDFYFRRIPLYASRKDHGLPWAEELARVWAEEKGLGESEASRELQRLKNEIAERSAWQNS